MISTMYHAIWWISVALVMGVTSTSSTTSASHFRQQHIESAADIPEAAQFMYNITTKRTLTCLGECQGQIGCQVVMLDNSHCSLYTITAIAYALPRGSELTSPPSNYLLIWKYPVCSESSAHRILMNVYITNGRENSAQSQTLQDIADDGTCYTKCLREYNSNCEYMSYNPESKTCVISSEDFYVSWTGSKVTTGAISCYKYYADKWKMVYRRPKYVSSGYTNEVTGPWFDTSFYQGNISEEEVLEPSGESQTILKSELVGLWEDIGVHQVRVGLYKSGVEDKHMLFSAFSTTSESWYTFSNLLSTSWKDLNPVSPPMYMGWWWEQGDTLTARGMYIARDHAGCGSDTLWINLIQNQVDVVCSYERNIPASNIPKLYYAPSAVYSTEPELTEADYLVISLSFL